MSKNLDELLSAVQEVIDNLTDAEEIHDENGKVFSDIHKLRQALLIELLAKKLVEKGLKFCPACGSDEIFLDPDVDRSHDHRNGTIFVEMSCSHCGLEWVEEYLFQRITKFEPDFNSKKILKESYPNLLD